MTIHARFIGAGIQPLIDAVKAAGAEPGDLRAVVWQATWARGYDDVVAPAPAARLKEEGFVVFARSVAGNRYATIVDTGHALWALVARGELPPQGARVRIVPAFIDGEIGWDVKILETLGLGMSIRFGTKISETNAWADELRDALQRIAGAEIERRKEIASERRSLVIEPMKPFQAEVDALQEQLRLRTESENGATPAERTAYERGNEKHRKTILDAVKGRRLKFFHAEFAALRARIPALQAEHDKLREANAEVLAAVGELEEAGSRSRGVSERVKTVEDRISAVEAGGLLVTCDLAKIAGLGPCDFEEISRSVELLYELLPRRSIRKNPNS